MQYGVDVAARRADDLDKQMMAEVAARVARGLSPTILDIGCGAGGQAMRLALLGAHVTGIDIEDYHDVFSTLRTNLTEGASSGTITFIQSDITSWLQANTDTYDFVCLQLTLHYVPYVDAVEVLKLLQAKTITALYLSVTGVTSAIADGYPHLMNSLPERFGLLTPDTQTTFSITAPLCIYGEDEVYALLSASWWQVEWSRVSDFGNIKVIATPQFGILRKEC